VDHTLNSSLLAKSPTRFDAGGFSLAQNTTVLDISRLFPGVAKDKCCIRVEHRIETYQIVAGEELHIKPTDTRYFSRWHTIFRPGGSQGFPGFQPSNEVKESRSNFGAYADLELDATKRFTINAAGRVEHYSDFGNTINGKLASRYKISDNYRCADR